MAGNVIIRRAQLQMRSLVAEAVHGRDRRLVRVERLRGRLCRNAACEQRRDREQQSNSSFHDEFLLHLDLGLALRQGEDDDCRQARAAKEGPHGPRRRRDMLLSIERVADHATTDAAAGVEAVKHLSGLGIEGEEFA
jgi:hypothetical protein